jgi:hypothetical protein
MLVQHEILLAALALPRRAASATAHGAGTRRAVIERRDNCMRPRRDRASAC